LIIPFSSASGVSLALYLALVSRLEVDLTIDRSMVRAR
jgi:hypothetical protein